MSTQKHHFLFRQKQENYLKNEIASFERKRARDITNPSSRTQKWESNETNDSKNTQSMRVTRDSKAVLTAVITGFNECEEVRFTLKKEFARFRNAPFLNV